MLNAAFGNWIRTLEERDFDDTLVALLRASGFSDIHFTHGAFEFGKDFIAKLPGSPPHQYAFQCKAGDIGGGDWDRIFAQLYQLAGTGLTHPSFDTRLPRVLVLVTTGRLTGKASACADQFAQDLHARFCSRFEVWDNIKLREMLRGSEAPQLPPSPELMPVLGRVTSGAFDEQHLESLLAPLTPPPGADPQRLYRAILDNEVVTATLVHAGQPFHALTAALNSVRIAATWVHEVTGDVQLVREALSNYTRTGKTLLAPLLTAPEDTVAWLYWCGGVIGNILAYPATCLRVIEYLGLSALSDGTSARENWIDTLSRVVASQPGVSRPISDRYASSLAPAVIALTKHGRAQLAATLLKRTAKWVCDRYERSEYGLADAYASAKTEAETLLGGPFEFVALQPRRASLLAVALADLAHSFAPDTYELIVNDILAVGIHPAAAQALDGVDGYRVGTGAITTHANIVYPDHPSPGPLPHQRRDTPRTCERLGVPEALLAIACLTRDRLFSDCYPHFATGGPAGVTSASSASEAPPPLR
jgi:hypothetical protein